MLGVWREKFCKILKACNQRGDRDVKIDSQKFRIVFQFPSKSEFTNFYRIFALLENKRKQPDNLWKRFVLGTKNNL